MSRKLFTNIVEEVTIHHAYFREKEDCTGRLDISPLLKCTSAICQLAYNTIFGPEYLRKPTITDNEKLYAFHKDNHGCDHGPNLFILLEAVASQDLWIRHAFFDVSEANNDINIIHQSPLFNDLKQRISPEIPFVANDVTYPSGYYLCDGIYPEWVTFFKSVSNLAEDDYKRLRYKRKHEAERKDVELTFGVVKNK
ncbi:ALP1-like protein [Tanacetum coccineum]